MKYKLTYILINAIILSGFDSLSQTSTSVINPDSVNTTLIESLIKKKIDSVRLKHKRNALILNDILQKAAIDHALYIKNTKKLTHYQNNQKKKTPEKRIAFYGLENTNTGENIANTFINTIIENDKGTKYENLTYKDAANDLVNSWVHSEGHFENIITQEYLYTGISVSYNKLMMEIYAVQVFSSE